MIPKDIFIRDIMELQREKKRAKKQADYHIRDNAYNIRIKTEYVKKRSKKKSWD